MAKMSFQWPQCTCGTTAGCMIHNGAINTASSIVLCAKCQKPVIRPKYLGGHPVCKLCMENEFEE
jgi:formylmethanofuran dehydrogenase subunit E